MKNIYLLDQEIQLIPNGEYLVAPLALFEIDFFGFVKSRSIELFPNDDIASNIWTLYNTLSYTNNHISSREVFKTNNAALGGLIKRIKQYDEIILEYIKLTIAKSEILLKQLN